MSAQKLFGPFYQILPLRNLPLKGALPLQDLEVISQGGILVENNSISEIGSYNEIDEKTDQHVERIKVEGNQVCLPGFVDAHTHICFGGSRAKEYSHRISGSSYLEIAKLGGGIWNTVQATRAASEEELTQLILKRVAELTALGITTIEVKSGYGLSVESELKMLRAIRKANQESDIDLIATCLAAHTLPKDFNGSHAEYLDWIKQELLPEIQKENLCHRVDAFVEEEAFTPKDIRNYFESALEMGFQLTVHADQFTVGGSKVAVDLGAKSADHLEVSKSPQIDRLAQSNTVAIALPGATMGLGCTYTPARELLDRGACLAIASDYNPGSAPNGNLLLQASLLAAFQKLTPTEVFSAITFRAAFALDQNKVGQLNSGYKADFVLFPTDDWNEILYQQGRLLPSIVVKNGKICYVKP